MVHAGVVEPGQADGAIPEPAWPERVGSLYAHAASSLAGNALGAAIVAAIYWPAGGGIVVGAWMCAFAAVLAARAGVAAAYRRAAPADAAQHRRWQRRWNAGSLASAALWGAAALGLHGQGPAWNDAALALIVSGLCVGSIPSLAAQARVYAGYVALAGAPLVLVFARTGRAQDLAIAGVLVLLIAAALLLASNYRTALERLLVRQARTDRLAQRLAAERDATEQARREAEAASRAKTRLLAAASHDLRQPLQALALFAQTLQERLGPGEHRALAEQVARSVDALEHLFDELFDIARIDSGVVQVRPRDFALGEVFERLRPQFEPLAFEKGLALGWRGGRHRVHADPALVDRILRNLLANAIRYTDDGGVLVAARARGTGVLLQVWDTGAGIRSEDRERVFDEFVQVGDAAAQPADGRRRGLGLGLAIVKRLAALSQAPLELRSVPGRGSVFSLRLPALPPPRPGAGAPASPAEVAQFAQLG